MGKVEGKPPRSEVSVAAIYTKGLLGRLLRLASPLLDRMLGVRRVRAGFERHGLYGSDRYEFIERFATGEKIRYRFDPEEFRRIPPSGPVVVVANHPLGGLEGILLTGLLRHARSDYKVFVNVMLMFIDELREFYIFTNPAAPGCAMNRASIGEARAWLRSGHCLLVFPAGRVGIYRPEKGYVTDETWDRLALALGFMTGASFVPVFIEGESSRLFSVLSHYIFPMKLLFLVWEFLRSLRQEVSFHVGRPIAPEYLERMGRRQANAWLRMRCYLESPVRAPEGGSAAGLSTRSIAFARAVRRGGGVYAGKRRVVERPPRAAVHPEVEDYIARYGLDEAEMGYLIEAIEGRPVTKEELLRELGEPGGADEPQPARPKT